MGIKDIFNRSSEQRKLENDVKQKLRAGASLDAVMENLTWDQIIKGKNGENTDAIRAVLAKLKNGEIK